MITNEDAKKCIDETIVTMTRLSLCRFKFWKAKNVDEFAIFAQLSGTNVTTTILKADNEIELWYKFQGFLKGYFI